MSCNCCYDHKSGYACACHTYENYTARKIIDLIKAEYKEIQIDANKGKFKGSMSLDALDRIIKVIEKRIHPDIYDKYRQQQPKDIRHHASCRRETRPAIGASYQELVWVCVKNCEA